MNRKENAKRETIKIRISDEEKKELKEFSALNRLTASDYIREALRIRHEMTRQKFDLSKSEYEEYEDYYDNYDKNGEENDEDYVDYF